MRPRSMTGFGRGEIAFDGRVWIAEIRTVNHRYLDQRIVLPRAFSALEDRVRKMIASNHDRGRVDVTIQCQSDSESGTKLSGNKVLANIVRDLCTWIVEQFCVGVFHFPYHVEKGGIYLKDSAVLASLGCVGRNNILVTPEFGPRIRLRALALDIELPTRGPLEFDPCSMCDDLCRKACPQHAFEKKIYAEEDSGQRILPGREGTFSKPLCNKQMVVDNEIAQEQAVAGFDDPVRIIKYCRRCELACPVGNVF